MRYRLSAAAEADLISIVEYSEDRFGLLAAQRLRARLQGAFQRIADGISLGHKRPDVPQELRLKFVVERPFVVAFDESSREIARVVHGARDIGAIFGGR